MITDTVFCTGGDFTRITAAIACTGSRGPGQVEEFTCHSGLAGGSLDAPDFLPAGAMCFGEVLGEPLSCAFFRG